MNKILYSKTPRQLASEIIAVLGFILLSISFKTIDITDCNAGELLHQVQTMQSQLPQKTLDCSKMQIMHKVIRNYDYLNEQLKGALDTIWENEAGRLLLRSFYENMNPTSSGLAIFWNARDCYGESNKIFYKTSEIYVDESLFVNYIGYQDGKIVPMPETLDSMLFHEILHGYHELIGVNSRDKHNVAHLLHGILKTDIKNYNNSHIVWGNDEEIHTISGWYLASDGKLHFDLLNTNSYVVLQALKSGISPQNIVQRLFHWDYGSWSDIHEVIREDIKEIVIPREKYIDSTH